MNCLTFYLCRKPVERGLNYSPVLMALLWVASGYGMTGEILQMPHKDGWQSVIKESGSLSKRRTQLVSSGINNRPWNTSSWGNASQSSLQEQNGYMFPRFRSTDHLHPLSNAMTAHQEGSESVTRSLRTPESPIDSLHNMAVEDNVASVVKRSIVAEPRKETFYTLEESNSTTATNSSTSFAQFYFPNPRLQPTENDTNMKYANHEKSSGQNFTTVEQTTTERAKPVFQCDVPHWQFYMKQVCVTVLTAAGLVGNSLAFCVLCSPVYSRKSYSYYLRALAIFDSLTLIITAIITWNEGHYELTKLALEENPEYEITFIPKAVIRVINGTNISTIVAQPINTTKTATGFLEDHSDFTCKLSNFFRNVVYIMSSWLVVCFTLDRYIAVRHPLQRSRLCTERRAKVVILCVFLFSLVSNIYQLVYMAKLDRASHNKCHAPKSKRVEFFAIDYFMFSFLLRFFIPFVVVCIFNGKIIFHIQSMRNMRKDMREPWTPSISSGNTQAHTSSSTGTRLTTSNTVSAAKKTNQAITTLYTVCLVFIITLSPNAIITAIQFIQYHTERSPDLLCNLLKAESPLQMVRLSNYAINFIIYGFTGRQFRRELFRLLKRRRSWSGSNGYHACQMRAQEMLVIRTSPAYYKSS